MSACSVTSGCWRASAWIEGDLVYGALELLTPQGALEWIERPSPAHRDDLAELEALACEISGGFLRTWRLVSHVAYRGQRGRRAA